jgi:hypothetical protein
MEGIFGWLISNFVALVIGWVAGFNWPWHL